MNKLVCGKGVSTDTVHGALGIQREALLHLAIPTVFTTLSIKQQDLSILSKGKCLRAPRID